MIFATIRGGQKAIDASHELLSIKRRGDPQTPELAVAQIEGQLALAVDRVMAEASLYDAGLAALAIKQAQGDLIEATFLLRAYRTTLERFGASEPLDLAAMNVRRRLSTTHKDVPGGQILGPTYDYTHRLLDFALLADDNSPVAMPTMVAGGAVDLSRDVGVLAEGDLVETEVAGADGEIRDLTREPLTFPAGRDQRLQNLARGDEGFLLGLAYSSMRGFGRNHPFIGEIRYGDLVVEMTIPELGLRVGIGEISASECRTTHSFPGNESMPPQFTRGYGLTFGQSERKVISMAIIDRALRGREFGEEAQHPVQDEEFVLSHSDSVDASGLVQHLKLPHYVDFQAELQLMRQLRREHDERAAGGEQEGIA